MNAKEVRIGKCRSCGAEFDYEVYPPPVESGMMVLFSCPRCTEPLFHICAFSLLGLRLQGNLPRLKSQSAVA